MQKLICPLQSQMVRHYKKCFLAQSKAFAFHCRSCHFKGFSCTNFVCQKCISTIQHMSDCIFLMLPKRNIRVHAAKTDMRAVVFTRTGTIEQLIVFLHQMFSASRVFPNPTGKSIFNCLLFLLCQGSFFLIQDTFLLSFCIFNGVIDTNIFQIQRFFQNPVRIGTGSAVSHISCHIVLIR